MTRRAVLATSAFAVRSLLAGPKADPSRGIIGHWKLVADAKDSSGLEHHGENRGVRFGSEACHFDGRGAYVEILHAPALGLGGSDFSLAAWIYTDQAVNDVIGSIASKYDSEKRCGFNLSVKTNAVTSSQSNYRNLHFGIDAGHVGDWQDCGRPGSSIFVMALAVYQGALYAGVCKPESGGSGHVYRYQGGSRWKDCGSPHGSNAISALAEHDGRLYAAASRYDTLKGSALPPSPNNQPGGRIFRYEGGSRWTDCGQAGEQTAAISSLAVYEGSLYATSLYPPAGTFRYDGGQTWTPCGVPEGRRVEALSTYNGALWGTGYDKGEIYRYDTSSWKIVGSLPGVTQTYGFVVYEGQFYVSTWPDGSVYRYDGDHNWVHCGRLGEAKEVMGMVVYNGKLYAGTLPQAEVYRYEGNTAWTKIGHLDLTPDVVHRRVFAMAIYRGKLYCGTLPSGHVFAFEAGSSATQDSIVSAGWRHVVAIRKRGLLKLMVDGKSVAQSKESHTEHFDIANEQPLRIGFGDHDYFNGKMRDVRLYKRALSEEEVSIIMAGG